MGILDGTLIGLRNIVWQSKPFKNQGLFAILLKIAFAFVFLSWLAIILIRMYEVPVNTTIIQLDHNAYIGDSANLYVNIVRNNDRKRRVNRDSTFKLMNWQCPGGIYVWGFILPSACNDSNKYHENTHVEDISRFLQEKLDPDSLKFDDVGEMLHVNVKTTKKSYIYGGVRSNGPGELYVKNRLDSFICDNKLYYRNVNYQYYDDSKHPRDYFAFDYYAAASKKDTVCYIGVSYSNTGFNTPDSKLVFFTTEDISRAVEKIVFKNLNSRQIRKLKIDYLGAADFGILNPAPDSIDISSIVYTTPSKINQIACEGLLYHVRFPDIENLQNIRITALVMAITLIVGVLFNLFYRFVENIKTVMDIWNNHPRFCIIILVLLLIFAVIFLFWQYSETSTTIIE